MTTSASEALVAADPGLYFRPPYVGHRGRLGMFLDGQVDQDVLEGLLTEAFVTVSPPKLRAHYEVELSARS